MADNCKKCGASEWIPNGKSRRCKPCHKAKNDRYYLDNKEKVDARRMERYYEDPAKNAAYTADYRARKLQATPEWVDQKEIQLIYSIAHEKGLEVDHIVPLRSELVCGLHVQDNLRCIPSDLNKFKLNRYWPDMPVEGLGG